ncbi:MAG: Ig-like domain-containing protein [Bacteroidota bacterium]
MEVPPGPGSGKEWQLQEEVSDDFNYTAGPSTKVDTLGRKWINWYHNSWTGPLPTVWKRENVFVEDGTFKVIATRTPGDSVTVDNRRLATTHPGCAHSVTQVTYPVYIEANVKIMKSVLACGVWLLSSDDTQEIDMIEAYGGDRWTHEYFSNKRVHLSHHVFIRQPFTDWQPHDAGSFYTDGSTVWNENFHRFGVYWRDPWHLEYYVDGKLVRIRSGKEQIDPVFHTNSINPGDTSNDTRTGLSKPMDIIIDAEDQTWRAVQGLSPTAEELEHTENNTFQVDWIRVYKPVETNEIISVSGVSLEPAEISAYIGDTLTVQANIEPRNANNLSVIWESDKPDIASIDSTGKVTCHTAGVATITVTTDENQFTATSTLTVLGEAVAPRINFDDTSLYLDSVYQVGKEIRVSADFHAGSGNTVVDGGLGGVRFWLREIQPGWSVAKDYIVSDTSVIGKEAGKAIGILSLEGVPPTSAIPHENWYFLYVAFRNSSNEFLDQGIYPINIADVITSNLPLAADTGLTLFPNPAKSLLNIELGCLGCAPKLQVLSLAGKYFSLPFQAETPTSLQLDIHALPKGLYFVKMNTDKVYWSPFVKN